MRFLSFCKVLRYMCLIRCFGGIMIYGCIGIMWYFLFEEFLFENYLYLVILILEVYLLLL